MSLKYRLAVRPNPTKPEEKRIYAVAVNDGYLTMDQVCKNIERTSTATRGDVKAIALAFSNYLIKSLTEEGNSLFLEDLGFFRVGVTSNGAATEKDFTADLITDKYINYQPKGELKNMKSSIKFERIGSGVSASAGEDEDPGNLDGGGQDNEEHRDIVDF